MCERLLSEDGSSSALLCTFLKASQVCQSLTTWSRHAFTLTIIINQFTWYFRETHKLIFAPSFILSLHIKLWVWKLSARYVWQLKFINTCAIHSAQYTSARSNLHICFPTRLVLIYPNILLIWGNEALPLLIRQCVLYTLYRFLQHPTIILIIQDNRIAAIHPYTTARNTFICLWCKYVCRPCLWGSQQWGAVQTGGTGCEDGVWGWWPHWRFSVEGSQHVHRVDLLESWHLSYEGWQDETRSGVAITGCCGERNRLPVTPNQQHSKRGSVLCTGIVKSSTSRCNVCRPCATGNMKPETWMVPIWALICHLLSRVGKLISHKLPISFCGKMERYAHPMACPFSWECCTSRHDSVYAMINFTVFNFFFSMSRPVPWCGFSFDWLSRLGMPFRTPIQFNSIQRIKIMTFCDNYFATVHRQCISSVAQQVVVIEGVKGVISHLKWKHLNLQKKKIAKKASLKGERMLRKQKSIHPFILW